MTKDKVVMYYLCEIDTSPIERSSTNDIQEAITMAKIMSRSSEAQSAKTIMVIDKNDYSIKAFVHNNMVFTQNYTYA